jgi:hypothetical protein
MEDIRTYRIEDENVADEEREYSAAAADDEVPFHVPRD